MTYLLKNETLNAEQVWWVIVADIDHSINIGSISAQSDPLSDHMPEAVMIIADTYDQVVRMIEKSDRRVFLSLNEQKLKDLLRDALPSVWQKISQNALHMTGAAAWLSSTHRYGIALHNDEDRETLQWHWVEAFNVQQALDYVRLSQPFLSVAQIIDVQVIMDVITQLKNVRQNGGAGVWGDARFEGQIDARRRQLRVEHYGGEENYRNMILDRRSSLGVVNCENDKDLY